MPLNKSPNVGTLDKSLRRVIADPVDDTTYGPYQLGRVAGAAQDDLFSGGTVRGRGKLQLLVEQEADRDILKKAIPDEEFGVAIDFLDKDANVLYSLGANQIAVSTGDAIAQVEDITTVADVGSNLDQTSFLLHDEDGSVGVWIDVGDTGSAIPAAASAADRAIEVTGVAADDTAAAVATAVAAALDADDKFSASAEGAVVTVTHATAGRRADGTDEDTGFTFEVTTNGDNPSNRLNHATFPILLADGPEYGLIQFTVKAALGGFALSEVTLAWTPDPR